MADRSRRLEQRKRYTNKVMRSVHDNMLNAYSVNGVEKRIVLHTFFDQASPVEYTDVVFEGVLDHYFRDTVLPSIIFDVKHADAAHVLKRDFGLILEGHRRGGWPSFFASTIPEMVDRISAAGCSIYSIESSYGLDGWVVAQSMQFIEV